MFRIKAILVFALVASLALFSSLLTSGLADGGANHRVRNQHFGVSGGNVNDAIAPLLLQRHSRRAGNRWNYQIHPQ